MSQTKAQLLDGKSATIQFTGGSASAPSVSFTGDTNTGIYSPGADQVAISTGGSGKLFVDASGNVGVSATPTALGTSVRTLEIKGAATNRSGGLSLTSSDNSANAFFYTFDNVSYLGTTATPLSFFTNNTERLRITSAGLVGIGTSTARAGLTVALGSASIPSAGAATGSAVFSNGSDSGVYGLVVGANTSGVGYIQSQRTDGTATTYDLAIQPNGGRVGIGTTSPSATLQVSPSSGSANFQVSRGSKGLQINQDNDSADPNINTIGTTALKFLRDGSESMRIDTSGRLLVGTSSARSNFYNSTLTSLFQVESASGTRLTSFTYGEVGNSGPIHVFAKHRSASVGGVTIVAADDNLGTLSFQGSDGTEFVAGAEITAQVDGTPSANDMPGRLVFSTTADGASSPTERMRITSGGTMLQGNTSDLTGVLGTGLKVKSNDVGTGYSAGALCLQGTGGDFYAIKFADGDMGVLSVTSTSVDYIQIGGSTSTATFYSNGLIQLPNVGTTASAANVFMDSTAGNQLARSTSSLRYKTDIEDLDTDRADAALSLRPVWYRSKATADRKDWSHYGLIAEEVAKIEPRLVNWTYLEDDYITVTNEYGIENKELKPSAKLVPDGVQYDRLPVLLLSVVQRQEKRIKQLEAEIAAVKAQLS